MTTQADVILQALADSQATCAALRRQSAELQARIAELETEPTNDTEGGE